MPLDDAKADELAKASRSAATAARASVKASAALGDRLDGLDARLGVLERRQSWSDLAHELVGLVKASPRIQAAVAVAIVVVVVAVALVYSPALPEVFPMLPLGGALAPSH